MINMDNFTEVNKLSDEDISFYLKRLLNFLVPHRFLPFDQMIIREAAKRLCMTGNQNGFTETSMDVDK